ncbi:MAG: hypothetical protein ABSD80_17805 [Caulobacteraceae bacterium]
MSALEIVNAACAAILAALLAFGIGIGIGVVTIYLPALHEFCAKVGPTCMRDSAQGEGFGWELVLILPGIIAIGVIVAVPVAPIVFVIAMRRLLRRPKRPELVATTFE